MTPEIEGLIDGLLVAPFAARSYLYKEIFAAFIQNIIVVSVFTYVSIGSFYQILMCAPITTMWFMS